MIELRRKEKIMIEPVNCGCGGKAKIAKKILMGDLPDVYVFCRNCSIRTGEYYSVAEAIQAWNRAMGARYVTDEVFDKVKGEVIEDVLKSVKIERTAKVVNYEDPFGNGGYGDCSECWAEVNEQYTYCPNCGARLEWNEF